MAQITTCNMCGRKFSVTDDFHLEYRFGYGSKFDNDSLNLDLCDDCLDSLVDQLVATCSINPVEDRSGRY